MKLDIGGEEKFDVGIETLWTALNDPAVLTKCVPGCKEMIPTGQDQFKLLLELKVASVGGSFEGAIALTEKQPPAQCRLSVSGEGSLGHGNGAATFSLSDDGAQTVMRYGGEGEIGGLVAGVGQRILKGVAKHLIGQFFKALRKEIAAPTPPA